MRILWGVLFDSGTAWINTISCNLSHVYACILVPGRCGSNFKRKIFKLITLNTNLDTPCGHAVKLLPQNLTSKKSALAQVMAWYHQATGHYPGQCFPSYMSPYGVAMPHELNNSLAPSGFNFKCVIFKQSLVLHIVDHFLWICHQVNAKDLWLTRKWLRAARQQAITWARVDPELYHHLASLMS